MKRYWKRKLDPHDYLELPCAVYFGCVDELGLDRLERRVHDDHVVARPLPNYDVDYAVEEVALREDLRGLPVVEHPEQGKEWIELVRVEEAPHKRGDDYGHGIGEKVEQAKCRLPFDDGAVEKQRKHQR